MTLFTLAFALFVLMNPIGNIPLFVSNLKSYSSRRKRTIIIRELLIALTAILFFMLLGQPLMRLLNIQNHSIYITGGLILFLIALRMIFPLKEDEAKQSNPQNEPFIVPLAIPLVAGPGTLSAVMIYSAQIPSIFLLTSAIIIGWLASSIILFFSPAIASLLGTRGIIACERLMGLLLTIVAVQMFLNGVGTFCATPALP